MNMQGKAIIFDLDGTLLDSAPDLTAALNHVLRAKGLPETSLAEARPMVGGGADKLIRNALARLNHAISDEERALWVEEFLVFYQDHLTDESTLCPHCLETLAQLKSEGALLAICTNKFTPYAVRIVQNLGASEYFSVITGYEQGGVRKPDAGHLKQTLDALATDGQNAIMVGDSMNDLLCARANHTKIIFAAYGYGAIDEPSDATIDSLAQLPTLIKNL